jgi:hypothetical protein
MTGPVGLGPVGLPDCCRTAPGRGPAGRKLGIQEAEVIKSRAAKGKARVTFTVDSLVGAQAAAVCGEWNGWSADADVMRRDAEGGFSVTVELDVGRAYRFRYLLDGQRWDNDWAADAYVANDFGGDDSVVDLTAPAEAVPPAARRPPAKKTAPAQAAKKAEPAVKPAGTPAKKAAPAQTAKKATPAQTAKKAEPTARRARTAARKAAPAQTTGKAAEPAAKRAGRTTK